MGIVKFSIIFDRRNKTYKPGETMTGTIELVLNSSLKIRGTYNIFHCYLIIQSLLSRTKKKLISLHFNRNRIKVERQG